MRGRKGKGTHLEKVLAEVVADHGPERREPADALPSDFERDAEEAESHESHRVGMLLVEWVEKGDEDPEEFLDRRKSEREDVAAAVCEGG